MRAVAARGNLKPKQIPTGRTGRYTPRNDSQHMPYTVKVNPTKCIGCGSCVSLAGKTFKLNSNNISEVLPGEHDDDQTVLLAAQSCPVSAIEVFDSSGKKL